jgi:hypothetical protein
MVQDYRFRDDHLVPLVRREDLALVVARQRRLYGEARCGTEGKFGEAGAWVTPDNLPNSLLIHVHIAYFA